MNMNKICTSLEESKKLIELGIDVNTADMCWSLFTVITNGNKEIDWLRCLRNRVKPQPDMVEALRTEYEKGRADALSEMKSSWSEEDERIRQCLIQDQEEALDDVRNDKYGHSEIISDLKEMYRERIDWLKQLKQRIGG